MVGTHSKNGCMTHTQASAGMQFGSGQACSWRAKFAVARISRDARFTRTGEKQHNTVISGMLLVIEE